MQYILDILLCLPYTEGKKTESKPAADAASAGWKGDSELSMKNMKLKIARMEKGLSQVQLAEKTDVTRQTIGMIEAGDFNPSLKLCIRICKALDKTLDDLFWEVE